MTSTVTVAQYLGRRLRSLGVEHLFGVPGDYTLDLLDAILADGALTWIGSPNELNAGYAADGYARTRGIAAVVTTFGVGELSAINAIAGSYAEHVPVIQITGAPPTAVAERGALAHHTLADGDFGRFARAYAEVTVAGEVLTARDAAAQIDGVLAQSVHEIRPGYLCVPVDVATALIPAVRLATPLPTAAGVRPAARSFGATWAPTDRSTDNGSDDGRSVDDTPAGGGPIGHRSAGSGSAGSGVEAFRRQVAALLGDAGGVVLIIGHLVERVGAQAALARLADLAASPVVTLVSARGAFDPTHPLYAGVYCGDLGAKRAILAVDAADVIIEVGTVMVDTATGGFTHRDDPRRTIHLGATAATVTGTTVTGVPLMTAIEALTDLLVDLVPDRAPARIETERPAGDVADPAPPKPAEDASPITTGLGGAGWQALRPVGSQVGGIDQASFWSCLERWFPAGYRLVTDLGTTFFGAVGITLPPGTDVVSQPAWASIGYALPATLGCALADASRRPVLVIGDGAAQMTVQELSTMARYGAAPIVIIIDNAGYTIERALQSPRAVYNDVPSWDWCALARVLAAGSQILTACPGSPVELAEALATAAHNPDRMALIHVRTPMMDLPATLRVMVELREQVPVSRR